MINRVLIRIKVVQLLYSYLISEKSFRLESQPTPPTKQSRFAYRLYLDMLVLMYRIAYTLQHPKGRYPLSENRFIKSIGADEKIKSLLNQYGVEGFNFEDAIPELVSEIRSSGLYKMYIKRLNSNDNNQRVEDVKFWKEVFNLIIMKDNVVLSEIDKYDNNSIRGIERMRELIADTFDNFSSSQDNVADALRCLQESMDKAYDLYLLLLMLPVQITDLQAERLNQGRNKFLPTDEDINPNLRFVENKMVRMLSDDPVFMSQIEARKLNWLPKHDVLLQHLLQRITESEDYKKYMELKSPSLYDDSELWRNLYKHIILKDADLIETLEEMSVYWNDDLDIIGTFVIKTFKRFVELQAGRISDAPVLPGYKDAEDAAFAAELFRNTVVNKEEYRSYIDQFINETNWDKDRLAFMDVVIVLTAIAEILNFPKIPIRVSVNEYIEMAKAYSTPKSGQFVNGLLASIIGYLKVERKLLKQD